MEPVPPARPSVFRPISYVQSETDQPKALRRAQTFQNGNRSLDNTPSSPNSQGLLSPDLFDSSNQDEAAEGKRASVDLDDMPIELIALADNFIESLSAKIYTAPPNIDKLAELYQEFYTASSAHINTHISAVATRQALSRDVSPSPSASSRASNKFRTKAGSLGSRDRPKLLINLESAQQMISGEEIIARKRARRALERKRVALEEAMERRLCESIYDRIYRHRSTQDEAQDDKLRSKTAALAMVGIGPADLGVDLGGAFSQPLGGASQQAENARKWLDNARRDLVRMYEAKYPLGKLNHLKMAHKNILETLSQYHPNSSADEIMPILIYTLITLPPAALNVISDVRFIQRFRWQPKLTGEAAYCLTNLEAAISFLETVDLSTLRDDELPSGPLKSASRTTGHIKENTFPPVYSQTLSAASPTKSKVDDAETVTAAKSPMVSSDLTAFQQRGRRLSELVSSPAQVINAASDAVFNTADQSLKTISNSLGDSYKFLFGKLLEREKETTAPAEGGSSAGDELHRIIVPKTLDDARKLVSTPPLHEDDGSVSGNSSIVGTDEGADTNRRPAPRDDRVLSFIDAWRPSRDHSADSMRSVSSLRKRLFVDESSKDKAGSSSSTSNPAIVESMRSLGNSLNPMARLSGISMIRGFGRTTPNPLPSTPSIKDLTVGLSKPSPESTSSISQPYLDMSPISSNHGHLLSSPRIAPPLGRFLDISNPGDLRLSEVAELLRDYRRLAGTLRELGAFDVPPK